MDRINKKSIYSKSAIFLKLFIWLVLWVPIVTTLICSMEFIVVGLYADTTTYHFDIIEDAIEDDKMIIYISLCLFVPWIIDSLLALYFYVKLKEFVEITFMQRVYLCLCC